MENLKPFEVTVAGRELTLMLGNCACVLFRQQQEVDYLAVDIEDDQTLRVFNNERLVRWMAGLAFGPEGYYNIHLEEDGEDIKFRDLYGWNPAVVIKEKPTELELEMWVEVNTLDLDGERDF